MFPFFILFHYSYHSSSFLHARNNFLECYTKIHVENGIDDRVECGIDVSQPGNEICQLKIGKNYIYRNIHQVLKKCSFLGNQKLSI